METPHFSGVDGPNDSHNALTRESKRCLLQKKKSHGTMTTEAEVERKETRPTHAGSHQSWRGRKTLPRVSGVVGGSSPEDSFISSQ